MGFEAKFNFIKRLVHNSGTPESSAVKHAEAIVRADAATYAFDKYKVVTEAGNVALGTVDKHDPIPQDADSLQTWLHTPREKDTLDDDGGVIPQDNDDKDEGDGAAGVPAKRK